jgi:hypothetical protein
MIIESEELSEYGCPESTFIELRAVGADVTTRLKTSFPTFSLA